MAPFVHLHVHSCFSFHDGVDTPEALVEHAAGLGYGALALTDTNGLYGAVQFCKAAKAAGIAPLLGAQIDGGNPDGPRAVVLARGRAGYPALCRIVTRRHLDQQQDEETRAATGTGADVGVARRGGLRRADRREHDEEVPASLLRHAIRSHAEQDRELKKQRATRNDGANGRVRGGPQRQDPGALHEAVATLAHLIAAEAGSVVALTANQPLLRSLAPLLSAGTLFGELVYAGDSPSAARCRETLAACRSLGLPFVATNAVRFAAPEGFATHRVLRAIGENGTVWSTPPRAHAAHFLKSPAEMAALFSHLPEALAATVRIAEECACPIGFESWHFPAAHVPPGETPFSVLWQKSFEGLRQRYRPISREAVERLRYELSIIEEKGFSPYFLVVDEIAAKAREWGLRMVGRGSAANSLVSHCLGLTHVDPLAHGLFFERFLNPERSSPPDIDLDFSWKDRDRLLAWVYERFGAERVAMISTHVTFGPRAAVREVGKAHGLPDAELTRLTKRIPHWGAHDLTNLAATVPECRSLPPADETLRCVLAIAQRIEGLPRHLSVHAGGIVIAPEPLTNFLPLERAAKGLVVTQCDMGPVEQLGLVKIDLLSQRSLGVLQDAVAAVERHTGTAPPVDERDVVLNDSETRRLVREGRTMGCFYIESPAMRSLLCKLRTETFEELTAASSVIRPGVAESGMMQEYIRRHHVAKTPSVPLCQRGMKEDFPIRKTKHSPADPAVDQEWRNNTDAGGVARRGGLSARQHASAIHASHGRFHGGSSPSFGTDKNSSSSRGGGAADAAVPPASDGESSPGIPKNTRGVCSDRTPQAIGTEGGPDSWYLHPKLAEVLRETHGVMIYQEDVLRVAHALAGMSLGQADTLRRSMSGKLRSPEAMAQVRDGFIAGCLAGGVGGEIAAETWRQIESFAGYAFCKAHSASYALLSLQVAYLKAHHPAEFMAAVISNQGGFYATAAYISESRRMGLRILLPDVNRSDRDYAGRGREIRMGLMAFAGLAEATIEGLLAARRDGGPFTNLSDLLSRSGLGRTELELLVRGGACDGFELTRPELLWRLACRYRATPHPGPLPQGAMADRAHPRPRGEGAGGGWTPDLFPGSGGLDHLVPRLPEYGLRERCRMEEDLFGFMVTRHPLEFVAGEPGQPDSGTIPARAGTSGTAHCGWGSTPPLQQAATTAGEWFTHVREGINPAPATDGNDRRGGVHPLPPLITAVDMARHAGRRVRMRGLAISYKRIPTKAGTWMKFLSLEDLTGTFEAVLFPDAYARCAEATLGTGPLLVEGRVTLDHGVPSLAVTGVEKTPSAADTSPPRHPLGGRLAPGPF